MSDIPAVSRLSRRAIFILVMGATLSILPHAAWGEGDGTKDTPYTRKMHEVLKTYNKANKAFYSRKYDKAKANLQAIFPLLDELKPLAKAEGYIDKKKNEKIYDDHMAKLRDGLKGILDLVDQGQYEEAKNISTKELSATCNACHKKGEKNFPGFGSKPARKNR